MCPALIDDTLSEGGNQARPTCSPGLWMEAQGLNVGHVGSLTAMTKTEKISMLCKPHTLNTMSDGDERKAFSFIPSFSIS